MQTQDDLLVKNGEFQLVAMTKLHLCRLVPHLGARTHIEDRSKH